MGDHHVCRDALGNAPGGVVSALTQVNVFGSLGIILATIGAVKDSGGRRSVNAVSAATILYFEYLGLSSYSKQALITPMVCWAVGVFYARLRVRFVHVVAIIFLALITFGFISPLSASRDLAEGMNDTQHLALAWYFLNHPIELQNHAKSLNFSKEMGVEEYYDTPQGSLIERLSMIPPDDELLAYTAQGHYEGMAPVYQNFGNLVPHFLNPDKQQVTYTATIMRMRWAPVSARMTIRQEYRSAL